VQAAFDVDRNIVNLNNGGVSPSPRLVQDALRRDQARANEAPAYAMWSVLEPEVEIVRARLAALFGCDAEEVAITRNACESLETVLFGFDLKAGDEVLTTNQDYPRTLAALRQRERREGSWCATISFPVPPSSPADSSRPLRGALTPRTRVLLVSHMTYLTGQIFPWPRSAGWAARRGSRWWWTGRTRWPSFPSAATTSAATTTEPRCTSG
jgi:selenocysteine lyase/cysteine desulfurase